MEQRRLILRADYFADPLWNDDRGKLGGMVRLEDLPLPDEVRSQLRTWAATFDALSAEEDGWPSTSAREEWNREGELLRNLVAEALGQGFRVTYLPYDE